LRWSQACWKL